MSGALAVPGEAVIDGEVVVVRDGRTNFSELQPELAAGRQGRLAYYAFDLLWRKWRFPKLPQIERKQLLLDLLGENDTELPVLYSEHLVGDGQKMFEHAAKLNCEGIISKRADGPYKSERGEAWVKIKTIQRDWFPVVGFVKDSTGVAALYLGKRERKGLVYMGKVGTGWSRTVSSQIRRQLDTVVSPKSKLTKVIKKFDGTPINQTLVNDLAGGGFIAQQRNVVLVGELGLARPIWPSSLREAVSAMAPEGASTTSSTSSTGSRPRPAVGKAGSPNI